MKQESGVGMLKNQITLILSIVLRCARVENTTTLNAQKNLTT